MGDYTMNICPHCQIGFNRFDDYHEHLMTHRQHTALESKAKAQAGISRSTSGRSKQQIVQEAEETWLKPLIITSSNEQEHLASCRCSVCFQRALDNLIKSQEDILNG